MEKWCAERSKVKTNALPCLAYIKPRSSPGLSAHSGTCRTWLAAANGRVREETGEEFGCCLSRDKQGNRKQEED